MSASLVIIHPDKRRLAPSILATLGQVELQPKAVHPGSAAALDEAIREHADSAARVIIAGGDGTLRQAAAALKDTQLPLGILPLGTANDLAQSLGLPLDWRTAINVIARGRTRIVDLGSINGLYFFNAAQIGLGAAVRHWLSSRRKRLWGAWSYAAGAWAALRHSRSFAAQLTIDGQANQLKTVHVTLGNGRQYGGGTPVAADASITDGRLDVLSIDPLPFWRLAVIAAAVRTGRPASHSHIHRFHGRAGRIATERPMTITADGDAVSVTPADFRVHPAAVRLYADLT